LDCRPTFAKFGKTGFEFVIEKIGQVDNSEEKVGGLSTCLFDTFGKIGFELMIEKTDQVDNSKEEADGLSFQQSLHTTGLKH
jgi:hypothetical protein